VGCFEGSNRLQLIVPAALGVVAGCMTERSSVSPQQTYPAAPAATQAAKPTNAAIKTPDPRLTRGSPPLDATTDPGVKRTANESNAPAPSPLVLPRPAAEYPIDLATALRLADATNPTIGAARTLILEALAVQMSARSLLLPSLNSGASYHGHNGLLQRSSGKMINVSLQSVFVGSGATAVVAGPPALPGVNIFCQLTDAWFEPLAARQRVAGVQFGAQATSYEILLEVSLLHLALLGNQSILELQRLSESQFHQVYRLAHDYAEEGEGREADAHRAFSQWQRRIALVQKAEEELAVTAARLANRLNLDPAVRLEPIGGPLVPLNLVPVDTPQQELLQIALRRRPDIDARSAAIALAEAHYKQEVGRPLLPTLWAGFSSGAFGGGSNLTPPLIGNFASRTDFDVRIYWTLLNFGAGNLSLIKGRNAEIGQAVAERSRTINHARDEVSASLAQAKAATNEIDVARSELAAAELGYKEDLDRTMFRGGEKARDVLPIELLNSLDLLASARVNLVRALVRYDQAQFRLWVALGSPPPLLGD
jgi:outer membrane protein TolC